VVFECSAYQANQKEYSHDAPSSAEVTRIVFEFRSMTIVNCLSPTLSESSSCPCGKRDSG